MAKKAVETREQLAEEKSMAQIASEALDAEEEKKKRIRRGKKQIILDKIKAMYSLRTERDVYKKELDKISASLDAMENAKIKKPKISETDVLDMFSLAELENLVQKKKEAGN